MELNEQQKQELMAGTPCDSDTLTALVNICHVHRLLGNLTREVVMFHPTAARRELDLIPAYLDRIRTELDKLPESL